MFIDRRRAPRVEVVGRIHGQMVSVGEPITVREISLGGLSFSSASAFPRDAVHEFRLTLGDGSSVLLRGRIVRSQAIATESEPRLFITGVQFIDDDVDDNGPSIGGLIDQVK